MIWLKSINLYAIVALILLGGTIVSGIYLAGARSEQRKWVLEMASRNAPILEQRGRDEAEIPAKAEAAKAVDAVVAAGVTQKLILNAETARLVNSVK